MKSAVLLGLACLLVVLLHHTADAAFARCTCGGRCGTFSCDPNNTRGCNCASCTCMRGSVGVRRCCQSNCGMWNSRKCFTCKVWQSCSCNGCR